MKPDISQLDPDQKRALELMLAGQNVYLGGRAGSGKSWVTEVFRDLCKRPAAFIAPTGMAALNIGGSTIHRFFGFPAVYLPARYTPMPRPERQRAIAATEVVVIDEISMVRSDLFQAMANVLEALPLPGREGEPFGGRQIVVSGDYCQLPPVASESEKMQLLVSFGGIFSFDTPAWQMASFRTAWLRQAHRQGTEREFVDALDAIRTGDSRSPEAMEAIRWLNRNATLTKTAHDCTTLCTWNAKVAEINARRDAELCSMPSAFEARVCGSFDIKACPAESHLELRIGSRVMVLANGCTEEGTEYVNGDTGVVTGIVAEEPMVGVLLDDGRYLPLKSHTWLEQEYRAGRDPETGEETLELVTLASMEQLPLKLAYAITIHKSQGMSLPRVHIDLARGPFVGGQLYVALSRCRSLSGLSLAQPLYPCSLRINERVRKFHREVLSAEMGDYALSPFTHADGAAHATTTVLDPRAVSWDGIDNGGDSAGSCPPIQIVW